MHIKWYVVGIKCKNKMKIVCIDTRLRCRCVAGVDRFVWKQFNLTNQKCLFIGELIIVGAVLEKFWEEFE